MGEIERRVALQKLEIFIGRDGGALLNVKRILQ